MADKLIDQCAAGKTAIVKEDALAHITDVAAVGEAFSQAEVNAIVTKLNAVIKRLEDAGISKTA